MNWHLIGLNDGLWGRYEGQSLTGDARTAYDAGHDQGSAERDAYRAISAR